MYKYLVGRVALIINVLKTNTEYLEDLSTGNLIQTTDLIKTGNNLLMVREPLTMLIPCCTKPLTKMHLSTQNSCTSNKEEKLVGTNINGNSILLK